MNILYRSLTFTQVKQWVILRVVIFKANFATVVFVNFVFAEEQTVAGLERGKAVDAVACYYCFL